MLRKLMIINVLVLFFCHTILFAVEPMTSGEYVKIGLKFRMFSPYRYSTDSVNFITTGIPLSRDPDRLAFREYFKTKTSEYFSLMQSEKNQLFGNIWFALAVGFFTGSIAVNTLVENEEDELHPATFPLIGAGVAFCAPTVIFRIRSFNNLKHAVKLRERRLSSR